MTTRLVLAFLLLLALPAATLARVSSEVTPDAVRLSTPGGAFSVDDRMVISPWGARINIWAYHADGSGSFFAGAARRISARKTVDTPERQVISAAFEAEPATTVWRLELELEVGHDRPVLLVRSRARKADAGYSTCHFYWSIEQPKSHWAAPGVALRPFGPPERYVDVGRHAWQFLTRGDERPGLGIVTDGDVARAPTDARDGAGPVMLYPPVRDVYVSRGDANAISFALTDARDPDAAISQATLVAVTGRVPPVVFDGGLTSPDQLYRPEVEDFGMLNAQGPALRFSRLGQISGVTTGAAELSPKRGRPLGGFFFRDVRRDDRLVPLRARPIISGKDVRVAGRVDTLWLKFAGDFRARGDRIEVSGELTDLRGRDRAITAYFALPVAYRPGQTRWWPSIEPVHVPPEQELFGLQGQGVLAGLNGIHTYWPLVAVTTPDAGIALAAPLDEPRMMRLAYNSATQQLYAAFDLALVRDTAKFPSRASFHLTLFACDPKWGGRDALRRYYALYPELFERRIERGGGWFCWGDPTKMTAEDLTLGYAYHWGGANSGDAARWLHAHGMYGFPYFLLQDLHQNLSGIPKPTLADVPRRLRWMADPKRTEPIPQWGYDHPYASALGDRDLALRQTSEAYLESLIYNARGEVYGDISDVDGAPVAGSCAANCDPEIPGGIGEFALTEYIPRCYDLASQADDAPDGLGMDNYSTRDDALDRRREHFRYVDHPLTFTLEGRQPCYPKHFATWEFMSALGPMVRAHGKYLIGNASWPTHWPYALTWLDVIGMEYGIEGGQVPLRMLAYHKPVCSLPCAPGNKQEKWLRAHLRMGIFPGGYADFDPNVMERALIAKYSGIVKVLDEAGWEPIPYAEAEGASIERFGGTGKALCFSIANDTGERRTFTVAVEADRLGVLDGAAVQDLVTGETLPAEAGRFEVTVDAGDVGRVGSVGPSGAPDSGETPALPGARWAGGRAAVLVPREKPRSGSEPTDSSLFPLA